METPKAERGVTRRTALEWLGKTAALSLAAAAGLSCFSGRDTQDSGPPEAHGTFPFHPERGRKEIYEDWAVRTVDRQDLEKIVTTWRLSVGGLVGSPVTFTFADLLQLPRRDQVADFHCVEGWSVLDIPWNGVHLSELARLAGPTSAATHVTFRTIGRRYDESLPLSVALEPRTILAFGAGGYTLPLPHGFPLRLVVPRLLAYKSAKYVERIEFSAGPELGYWTARGYDYLGEVPPDRLRPGKW